MLFVCQARARSQVERTLSKESLGQAGGWRIITLNTSIARRSSRWRRKCSPLWNMAAT